MKVSIDLGTELSSQFEKIQKQLLGLKSSKTSANSSERLLASMTKQQDVLLRSMERLLAFVTKTASAKGMNQQLGRIESALVQTLKRGRNRTFGSNF